MQPLLPPESFHLSAAQGWLMLGNHSEALAELDRIPAAHRLHPDVLELRWTIHAGQSDWQACFNTAQGLVDAAPERVSGWVHRAYALRRLEGQGLHSAWNALLPAAERFPDEPIIPYNLACYACQKSDLPAARAWLKSAFELADRAGDKPRWMRMALSDPDLEPLWPEIRRMGKNPTP